MIIKISLRLIFVKQDHINLMKYCQDYGEFQEVLFFVQKTKGNLKDSEWFFLYLCFFHKYL